MNKYLTGILLGIVIVVALIFGMGLLEEAEDGPLEKAADTVEDKVDNLTD